MYENIPVYKISYFQTVVDRGLGITLSYFELYILEDQKLHGIYVYSMLDTILSNLIRVIESCTIRTGLTKYQLMGALKYQHFPKHINK